MGLRYAQLERKMGEIDRARGIYTHISQFTDPSLDLYSLWKIWNEFELQHGNEDTYKEYMRIKRSVQAKYSFTAPSLKQVQEKMELEESQA